MQEKSRVSYQRRNYKEALSAAQTATVTYKALDMEDTKTGYIALYYLSLAQMKKDQFQQAGHGFEKIFLNTKQILSPKSPYIGRAFIRHGQAFSKYLEAK